MLDVGRNQSLNGHPVTVQPANFLRAFRTLPEASAMGLLVAESHPEIKIKTYRQYSSLQYLIIGTLRILQSWARFILQPLSSETMPQSRTTKEQSSKMFASNLTECNGDGMDASIKLERDASPSEESSAAVFPIAKLVRAEHHYSLVLYILIRTRVKHQKGAN